MGPGKDLGAEEQEKLAGISLAGWSIAKIARVMRRSRNVVTNYIRNVEGYRAECKNAGRKPKIAQRALRWVLRETSINGTSSRTIRDKLNLSVHRSQVGAVLEQHPTLRYIK